MCFWDFSGIGVGIYSGFSSRIAFRARGVHLEISICRIVAWDICSLGFAVLRGSIRKQGNPIANRSGTQHRDMLLNGGDEAAGPKSDNAKSSNITQVLQTPYEPPLPVRPLLGLAAPLVSWPEPAQAPRELSR